MTAIYMRISREDGGEGESESIQNQRAMLLDYCHHSGYPDIREYADDGRSGLNFDRPAFNRLLEDIEQGLIQTVITKDLSRLGRDYILTGHYIERYFPERNIRYIAVNDGIDTFEDSNDMTPFRAVINDMYARDISKKVRSALDTKRISGLFIGAKAPYGYKKSPLEKGRLVIDEKTRANVEAIFRIFLETCNLSGTARRLNSMEIAPPSDNGGGWNPATVRRILTNPTYIGSVTQRRTRKISHKIKKRMIIPREGWMVVENTHEGIIDRDIFFRAGEIIRGRKYSRPV